MQTQEFVPPAHPPPIGKLHCASVKQFPPPVKKNMLKLSQHAVLTHSIVLLKAEASLVLLFIF